VKDPLIGLPPQMTWLQHIEKPANDEKYDLKLIFALICSKKAKDLSLHVLEEIVNETKYILDWVRYMNMAA